MVDTYEGYKIIEYDIMLKNDEMLYKHVAERDIIRKLYKKQNKKDKGGQLNEQMVWILFL